VFDHALADAKLFLEDCLSVKNESDRIQLIVNSYLTAEVDSKTKPSDEQIAEYYNKHKKDFFQPVKVNVREMLITSDDTLKMVQKLLTAGAPFDSLAKVYSAADSKSRSGYVGFIEEGKSAKPYERQALKLKENAVSRPIKTDEGYWLVKCESRQDAKQPTLDDSRYQINSLLANQKKDELEKALKEKLMSGAEITITQAGPEPSPTLEIAPVPSDNDTDTAPEDNN
jgi:parvulin-like peptidyl-prolyl isomerase